MEARRRTVGSPVSTQVNVVPVTTPTRRLIDAVDGNPGKVMVR